MSWWVYLEDHDAEPWCGYGKPAAEFVPEFDGDTQCTKPCYPSVEVNAFEDGGTYVVGGSSCAELNVTYNYGARFAEAWDGVGFREALHGKRAHEVLWALERGVRVLGTARDEDYWASTQGNAGAVLERLLSWARQHPDAIFRVS